MADVGGILTKQDLVDNRPQWLDPISVDYRDWTVWAPPAPCQAIQYLETLKLLEGFDIAAWVTTRPTPCTPSSRR